ncbi:DMT family transporter [Hyphomicrobium sp. CS1BSMeth3]|uniref:DMT family transporter n=1 Tax=Hyphomicrobium sp. CS1BSMeth3 TaxID=1892844 RepID=UPI0009303359|nr:DMT family transporter [Hyphomicrobium sp. CS1BSMeth3]
MTGHEAAAVGSAERRIVVSAVLLMLCAGFNSSLLHLGVRFVGAELPTIEIVFLRALFTLLMTAPFVFRPGKVAWRTNNLPLQLLRGSIGVASMWSWYYALANMPLADAGVLSFTTPIFITIGAALYFRETVGPVRSSAVVIGLIGAAIVLKPGFETISLAAVAAVGSSILWAMSLLIAKDLTRFDSPITISFYQPLMIAPIAGLAAIPVWVMPSGGAWLALVGMGAVAALGNFCYVQALKMVDASLLMPADYVRLLWMVTWGYIFFSEVPGWSTWLGAALIVGSTLFVTWREAKRRAET